MKRRLLLNSFGFILLSASILLVNCQARSGYPITPTIINQTTARPRTQVDQAASKPFVTVKNDKLMEESQLFTISGFNFYPKDHPWQRFFSEYDPALISQELDLVKTANINTIRMFIWHEPFFNGGQPVATYFDRLDSFLSLCAKKDLRVIVTLNDLADLSQLYTNYPRYDPEFVYITSRYKDNPTILAFDLKNEPDTDYYAYGKDVVQAWLSHASKIVKMNAPKILLTVGYWHAETIPTEMDFVSFHHWLPGSDLAFQIDELRKATTKPILLEETGLPSASSPDGHNETDQAAFIKDHLAIAAEKNIAGFLIWTAFDFPLTATCHTIIDPECKMQDSIQNHMGIWRSSDYSPKPAFNAMRAISTVYLPVIYSPQ